MLQSWISYYRIQSYRMNDLNKSYLFLIVCKENLFFLEAVPVGTIAATTRSFCTESYDVRCRSLYTAKCLFANFQFPFALKQWFHRPMATPNYCSDYNSHLAFAYWPVFSSTSAPQETLKWSKGILRDFRDLYFQFVLLFCAYAVSINEISLRLSFS